MLWNTAVIHTCKVPSPRGAAATVLTTNKCRNCPAAQMQLCPEWREGTAWPSHQQRAFCSFLGGGDQLLARDRRNNSFYRLSTPNESRICWCADFWPAFQGYVRCCLVGCLSVVIHCVNSFLSSFFCFCFLSQPVPVWVSLGLPLFVSISVSVWPLWGPWYPSTSKPWLEQLCKILPAHLLCGWRHICSQSRD